MNEQLDGFWAKLGYANRNNHTIDEIAILDKRKTITTVSALTLATGLAWATGAFGQQDPNTELPSGRTVGEVTNTLEVVDGNGNPVDLNEPVITVETPAILEDDTSYLTNSRDNSPSTQVLAQSNDTEVDHQACPIDIPDACITEPITPSLSAEEIACRENTNYPIQLTIRNDDGNQINLDSTGIKARDITVPTSRGERAEDKLEEFLSNYSGNLIYGNAQYRVENGNIVNSENSEYNSDLERAINERNPMCNPNPEVISAVFIPDSAVEEVVEEITPIGDVPTVVAPSLRRNSDGTISINLDYDLNGEDNTLHLNNSEKTLKLDGSETNISYAYALNRFEDFFIKENQPDDLFGAMKGVELLANGSLENVLEFYSNIAVSQELPVEQVGVHLGYLAVTQFINENLIEIGKGEFDSEELAERRSILQNTVYGMTSVLSSVYQLATGDHKVDNRNYFHDALTGDAWTNNANEEFVSRLMNSTDALVGLIKNNYDNTMTPQSVKEGFQFFDNLVTGTYTDRTQINYNAGGNL